MIATDHQEIADAVAALGWRVCTTSVEHETGTDRLAEAVDAAGLAGSEIVVNVQGDEPLIDPKLIRKVAGELALRPKASIATAAHPDRRGRRVLRSQRREGRDRHRRLRAILLPRADPLRARRLRRNRASVLPEGLPAYRHIGLYAYRVSFLREYSSLSPTAAERFEALEQLRALGHGHRIAVAFWNEPMEAGVDTAGRPGASAGS